MLEDKPENKPDTKLRIIPRTALRGTTRWGILFASLFLLASFGVARDRDKAAAAERPPANSAADSAAHSATLVDEGSLAIFQNGRRVASEDFVIRQLPASSVTSSHIHLDSDSPAPQPSTAQPPKPKHSGDEPDDADADGHAGELGVQSSDAHDRPAKASPAAAPAGSLDQSSELTLLPDGSLSRYEWKQSSPKVSSATVVPEGDVLVLHSIVEGKKYDHSFFLSPDAFILDDYAFASREVLLWRYMASYCKPRATGDGCDLLRARFPIVAPQRNTSGEVYIEFKGFDDTPLNGRPQHLRHFLLTTDGPAWHLWLDEKLKLLRISIPDASTEVLRQEK